MEEKVYTVQEVARILKTGKNTVYTLIKNGHLKAIKIGRLKITERELRKFLGEENRDERS